MSVEKFLRRINSNRDELDFIFSNLDKYYTLKPIQKFDENKSPILDSEGNPVYRYTQPSKGRLKQIQFKLNIILGQKLKIPECNFGGLKGKSNISNARYHQGNKYFFVTDIKNYYPSISHQRIYNILCSSGFSPQVASLITKICTYQGKLPQGTHTSPILANLAFSKYDLELMEYCRKAGIKYTRFVDDLTFSSPKDFKEKLKDIRRIIHSSGFITHWGKTSYGTKKIVTGILMGNNGLNVPDYFEERKQNSENLDDIEGYIQKVKSA